MKSLSKVAVTLLTSVLLVGFSFGDVSIDKSNIFDQGMDFVKGLFNKEGKVATEARKDEPVVIDPELNLKELSADEKATFYEELNQIDRDTTYSYKSADFEAVEELTSEQDYYDFIMLNSTENKILYLGYDECEYCQAFLPKLAKLAADYETTIYLYDTSKRLHDLSYQDVIDNLHIETVPHAFIFKNGKPGTAVNYNSSMKDLEAFVKRVVHE